MGGLWYKSAALSADHSFLEQNREIEPESPERFFVSFFLQICLTVDRGLKPNNNNQSFLVKIRDIEWTVWRRSCVLQKFLQNGYYHHNEWKQNFLNCCLAPVWVFSRIKFSLLLFTFPDKSAPRRPSTPTRLKKNLISFSNLRVYDVVQQHGWGGLLINSIFSPFWADVFKGGRAVADLFIIWLSF